LPLEECATRGNDSDGVRIAFEIALQAAAGRPEELPDVLGCHKFAAAA
jgi:hypothetical protein